MERNSFSFMKEGFDWEQEQSKDMQEIDYKDNSHGIVGQWQDYDDRHVSDEEELKREQEIMRNDDLRDEYRERGLDPRDFYSEVD